MTNPLIRKLELFGPLPESDKRLLDEIVSRSRTVEARHDVISEGEPPADVHLILSGFACRYKILQDGNRQIFAYFVPGDFCDLHVFILKSMDHAIGTLARCELVDIPRSLVLDLIGRPAIARAFWWVTLVDEATLREWIVNLGARDAFTRIAHLFCEIHLRLESIGLVDGGAFELPITQAELGDTVGITAVHVSRTLQELRSRQLLDFQGGRLLIRNVQKLREVSGFNPNYLHLDSTRAVTSGSADHLKLV